MRVYEATVKGLESEGVGGAGENAASLLLAISGFTRQRTVNPDPTTFVQCVCPLAGILTTFFAWRFSPCMRFLSAIPGETFPPFGH